MFRVKLELNFRPDKTQAKVECIERFLELPFPPFVSLYFDNLDPQEERYDRGPFKVESVWWNHRKNMFVCDCGEDNVGFDSLEEALAFYGAGWQLMTDDEAESSQRGAARWSISKG